MGSEKDNAEFSESVSVNMVQEVCVQKSSNSKYWETCHFGRALAYRAVYGSSSYSSRSSRNVRGNNARISPSRLSKVSMAGDADNTDHN